METLGMKCWMDISVMDYYLLWSYFDVRSQVVYIPMAITVELGLTKKKVEPHHRTHLREALGMMPDHDFTVHKFVVLCLALNNHFFVVVFDYQYACAYVYGRHGLDNLPTCTEAEIAISDLTELFDESDTGWDPTFWWLACAELLELQSKDEPSSCRGIRWLTVSCIFCLLYCPFILAVTERLGLWGGCGFNYQEFDEGRAYNLWNVSRAAPKGVCSFRPSKHGRNPHHQHLRRIQVLGAS
jgi:hypothetical protein